MQASCTKRQRSAKVSRTAGVLLSAAVQSLLRQYLKGDFQLDVVLGDRIALENFSHRTVFRENHQPLYAEFVIGPIRQISEN